MRIGRAIIISAILSLGAAGSILAASTASVTAPHAPSAHVVAATNGFPYHG